MMAAQCKLLCLRLVSVLVPRSKIWISIARICHAALTLLTLVQTLTHRSVALVSEQSYLNAIA